MFFAKDVNVRKTVLFAALYLLCATGEAGAADQWKPVQIKTENAGKPNETLVEFRIDPEVDKRHRLVRSIVRNETLRELSRIEFDREWDAVRKAGAEEGWSSFNFAYGVFGSGGTLGENALSMGGLKGVNSAMTNLGLFMTFWQVSMDYAAGRDRDMGVNAYKGIMSFAIGTWGSAALQIGNIGLFALDSTLSMMGTGAWMSRTDAWRIIYTNYYSDLNAAAERAQYGSQPILKPTREQRLARIRGQTDGGRALNDWKFLLYEYYRTARTPEHFRGLLEAELARYVALIWSSPRLNEYLAGGGSTAALARATSLTQQIKTKLENEYRETLMAWFIKEVFPEIAYQAWREELKERVAELNREVLPVLNQVVTIEIGAFDLSEPAKFTVERPAGDAWEGTLDPSTPRALKITKLAMLRAGMPHEITLELPGGPVTRPFILVDDYAQVSFGKPETPVVAVYETTESRRSCRLRRTRPDGTVETKNLSAPARSGELHFAVTYDGGAVLGRYDASAQDWASASPGAIGEGGARMLFSVPRHDGIAGLSNCKGGFLEGESVAALSCEIERRALKVSGDGTRSETTCTSQGQLKLTGAFADLGQGMRFVSLDGAAGAMLRGLLAQGMARVAGGSR